MPDDSSMSLFPFLRSGFGAISIRLDGEIRRKATGTVNLVDENNETLYTSSQTRTLKGPGEVLGFKPSIIARTEPANGENDHEPNIFACVESSYPSFFWQYSLEDGANQILKPWVVLIVLKRSEFKVGPNNNVKLPTILVGNENEPLPLPDLNYSWAWAHVQIAGNVPENPADIANYIAEHPELHCSRIICLRAQESYTLYSGLVVPAREMARLAGLGVPFDINIVKDAFSWKHGDKGPLELPVYYRFDFQTSEPGDIERLIDILQFRPVPRDDKGNFMVGIRPIDGSKSGFLTDETGNEIEYPGDNFLLEGALVPPGFFREGRQPLSPSGFTQDILPRLNKSFEEVPVHDDDTIDPLVSIPVYGKYFQRTEEIISPNSDGAWNISRSWIHELNLDRRYRATASMGAAVVQRNQEELMNECWDRLGEIKEANDQLRLCGAGKLISDSLKERHIDPLKDARFVLITEPFHHYYAHSDGRGQKSFKSRFKLSGLPRGTVSYPFKRMVSQMVGFERQRLFGPWELAAKNEQLWKRILRMILYILKLLLQLLNSICRGSSRLNKILPLLIKLLHYLKVPAANEEPRLPDRDPTLQGGFKEEFAIDMQLPDIYPLKSEVIPVAPIDIKKEFRPRFDIKQDLLERLNGTIKIPWKDEEYRLTSFNPIMKTPKMDFPMYRYLIDQSVDLMVPGLGKLEKNTVVLMEENRKFIESFLLSANEELGKEAIWRECAVVPGATFFNHFWDPTKSENPPYDIKDIHEWGGELGANAPDRGGISQNNLVLAIKADLIRRYPETIIFSIKRKENMPWDNIFGGTDNGQLEAGDDSFIVYPPIYSANIGVDVLFLGFPFSLGDIERDKENNYGYYFVFMQHPSLPRWGYDVGEKYAITSYDGTTKVATVDRNWARVPDNASSYCIFVEGQARGGEVLKINLASNASANNDEYNGKTIEIVRGKGIGQTRIISDYDGSSKTVTVDPGWNIIPDESTIYRLVLQKGTARGGTASTITLANDASALNDAYKGMIIRNLDLDSWDNLSEDHLEIEQYSGWIRADKLKDEVSKIPGSPLWGESSVAMAAITLQKPVRIVVSSDKLLEPSENEVQ